MSRYLILSYRPLAIAKAVRNFDYYRDFIYKYGSLSSEYYNKEYGQSRDDAKNAFAHSVWVVSNLSNDKNNKKLLESLVNDYKNLLLCLKNGFGTKDDVFILTQILLEIGLYRDVSIALTEYKQDFENTVSPIEREKGIARNRALNFDKLYVQAGDYALSTLFDVNIALLFYHLASFSWGSKNNDWFINDNYDLKSPLTKSEKEGWVLKVKSLKNIIFDYSENDYSCFNVNETIKNQLIQEYNECVLKIKTYAEGSIDCIDNFIEKYSTLKNKSYDCSLLFHFMIGALRTNYASHILFFLSSESRNKKSELRDEIIKLFRNQDNNRYREFIDSQKKDKISLESIFRFVKLDYYENQLLTILRVPSNEINCAYYTSYKTFSYMLPENCINEKYSECGKLSIMNISYMNDPNEGKTIRNYIYKDKEAPKSNYLREVLKTQYVFIKCFTSMIDYLPMWQMYGDGGKGVCLYTSFSNANDTQLYNVCYVKNNGTKYSIRQNDNSAIKESCKKVDEIITEISTLYSKISDEKEKLIFDSSLDKISFLFKDSSYSYEQEIRIMYSFDKRSNLFKHTKQDPPKLFINTKDPALIKEIILGPKFDNIVDIQPYLQEQLEEMSDRTGLPVPLVSISNIDFR